MAEHLAELLRFLCPEARSDVKIAALDDLLGLTGTEEGRTLVSQQGDVVYRLLLALGSDAEEAVARDALLVLLNLSAFETAAESLVKLGFVQKLLRLIVDPSYRHADKSCMLLSNLTRLAAGAQSMTETLKSGKPTLDQLVEIFNQSDYNKNAQLHYLATVFSNVSQLPAARQLFLDQTKPLITRLLPFVQYQGSVVRRGGIIGFMRNLCFEVDSHKWLLSEQVDLLPVLLLPLAGPEQFSSEEMDKLPLDLQYLPDNKQREQDPDMRIMLVEAITKLCSTKHGRHYLRENQTYLIIRELHQQEKAEDVVRACENLISILIADEPKEGMEELHQVDIPPHIAAKFDT